MIHKAYYLGEVIKLTKIKTGWTGTIKGVEFLFWKGTGATPWKARRKSDKPGIVLWADTTLQNCAWTIRHEFV